MSMYGQRDPDEMLVVLFRYLAMENPQASLAQGRPIFDDVEVCEIRAPGSKDVKVFPSTEFCGWKDDPFTGAQRKWTYAERFQYQYRQFKNSNTQTKTGTPLDHVRFLSEGRRAELRAQNLYTVEQLAGIEGNELKNLGPGGRDMKNQALEYIEESKSSAPSKQMMAELEALRARNAILEEDQKVFEQRKPLLADSQDDGEFADMTDVQLREYIKANNGHSPVGQPSRKNLIRMAMDCKPTEKAV